MDLYTLSDTFLAKDVVDQYVSAIWTERYSSAGDVQLVVPATPEMIERLADGTFLALRGSREVMELSTQSIDKGLMTVVGSALPEFLNQRYAWFKNPDSDSVDNRIADYTDETRKPGEFIADVVNKMVINTTAMTGDWIDANLDWDLEEIPYLELGDVDTSGTVKRLTVTTGPLYDAIQPVAEKENIGFSLYLESADPIAGYVLKFTTYTGKDRTSDQTTYPLVRLLPDMDSLSDVKEVRSIANYKNIAYVFYKGEIHKYLADPDLPEPEGFARRVLITDPDQEPVGHKVPFADERFGYGTYTVVDPADVDAFLAQNAKDALANHNYIRAVDGQTSPNNDYQYGRDYNLGDIIELKSFTGTISKARVTEYIRSHDEKGERAYPTISVLTPEGGG
jgi:hypothetical protein